MYLSPSRNRQQHIITVFTAVKNAHVVKQYVSDRGSAGGYHAAGLYDGSIHAASLTGFPHTVPLSEVYPLQQGGNKWKPHIIMAPVKAAPLHSFVNLTSFCQKFRLPHQYFSLNLPQSPWHFPVCFQTE